MKFVWLNHWYPEAWSAWDQKNDPALHGTAFHWDIVLQAAGHESETLVLNSYAGGFNEMYGHAASLRPDIVVSMEVGRFNATMLRERIPGKKYVAFCSHRADDANLLGWDMVFSSFKWMPDYVKQLGGKCEYLPLAFGRSVLDHVKTDGPRDIPVAFIGGLGNRIWDQGTRTMAAIAEAMPDQFVWRGYWAGNESDIPESLRRVRQPEVYGIDMYRMLARTKIALNRHGEIASRGGGEGWGNNCRQWESLGMACSLLTDDFGEVHYGTRYTDAANAVYCINGILNRWDRIERQNALEGQQWVLKEGTFEARVPRFLEVIGSL